MVCWPFLGCFDFATFKAIPLLFEGPTVGCSVVSYSPRRSTKHAIHMCKQHPSRRILKHDSRMLQISKKITFI